jgi:hypothetical protein
LTGIIKLRLNKKQEKTIMSTYFKPDLVHFYGEAEYCRDPTKLSAAHDIRREELLKRDQENQFFYPHPTRPVFSEARIQEIKAAEKNDPA